MSEDCLYLNVWTPRAERGAKLPVMVWIHGGALVIGAGSQKLYDGAVLARQGVVVVTVNYRLGPLGFFVHPSLDSAAPHGPANFGMLDQIAALRWVQSQIEAFGGDPHRVTVFGESAGAQSVLALMASPLAHGLFQRAIAHSAYGIPSHSREKALRTGTKVAGAVGLAGERATLAQLRAVPAEKFATLEGPDLTLAPSFIVGDAAVPRPILAAFQSHLEAAVPLIIGNNSDDSSVAVAFGLDPAALVAKLGAARVLVGSLYPSVQDPADLGRQVVRDVVFAAFARRIAVLHSQRVPTWRYYFDYLPKQLRATQPGVTHGGEITSVFGTGDTCECLSTPPTDEDRRVAKDVMARWVAFARAGVPQVDGDSATPSNRSLSNWPADTRWKPVVLDIGDTQTAVPGFMRHRLDAFIGVLNLVGAVAPSK